MNKLEVAMKYVDRMADGKNPVKNTAAEEDSILNNPNVIRCMYFIKEVLTAVKENDGIIGGKAPKPQKNPFPYECLSSFQYIEDTTVSHFLAQLKALANDPDVSGIKVKTVTDWLTVNGYLVYVQDKYTGKKHPEVTEAGTEFGLYMNERTSMRGESYISIMYSRKAQEYLAANLEKIEKKEL
ncbi:MAG: hypothetical protein Q4B85_07735 [Lachnospiraceae bacterium]|nr:hypothetical protein [Lachnospiraceae bacterium]